MAIEITIGDNPAEETPTPAPEAPQAPQAAPMEAQERPDATVKLNARRTLDGNLMIFDHSDIDIVVMPEKKKIVTFAKKEFGDETYETQNRFFRFLFDKGIVAMESVKGGNVYSSIEASMLESKDHNALELTLFSISKFIEDERPFLEWEEKFEEEEEQRLLEPSPQDSTEYDPEKYHKSMQGSLPPYTLPYGLNSIYRI